MIEKLPIIEPTKMCPLCGKVLLETYSGKEILYFCQTRIKFEGKLSLPHYEIVENGVKFFYCLPAYRLEINAGKTYIWEMIEDFYNPFSRKPSWKLILEIPREIAPSSNEKLVEKIKTLLVFS